MVDVEAPSTLLLSPRVTVERMCECAPLVPCQTLPSCLSLYLFQFLHGGLVVPAASLVCVALAQHSIGFCDQEGGNPCPFDCRMEPSGGTFLLRSFGHKELLPKLSVSYHYFLYCG